MATYHRRSRQRDENRNPGLLGWIAQRLNAWVILGALVIAAILTGGFILLIFFTPPQAQAQKPPEFTVIPGPTSTPTLPAVTPSPTPTPPVTVGGIFVGAYVKISGTEGSGLRLRSEPGTNKTMLFVAMDDEIYQVKDGPRDAEGYTWWYLQAPYDTKRSGWAVSKYLTVVGTPPPP